jgi:tripartite-type tricarboxylate transporter receptor subunit TctC
MIRSGAIFAVAFLFSISAGSIQAQPNYPDRVIKLAFGSPPGGNLDAVSRIVAHGMEQNLGQQIVVQSILPGLGGAAAAETISRSPPDGYALLVLSGGYAAYSALSKTMSIKPVADLTWISLLTSYPFMFYVRKDSRLKTLGQLIKIGRTHPGELKFGSAGAGSLLHTVVELLAYRTGGKFLHVPYRGEVPAINALLRGDIDFVATTTGPTTEYLKSGQLRALAVTGKTRWRAFPDVPTVEEAASLPGFEVLSWAGLVGPPKLPQPVITRLSGAVTAALAMPDVSNKLQALGGDVHAGTPEQFKSMVQDQYDTWKKLGAEAHISLQ